MRDVRGVLSHEPAAAACLIVVSIKQRFLRPFPPAGYIAAQCQRQPTWSASVIVVDDDVDPMNLERCSGR